MGEVSRRGVKRLSRIINGGNLRTETNNTVEWMTEEHKVRGYSKD